MVLLVDLWLPIILSAVFVFVLSSLIHTLLGYHNSDFRTMPGQDQVMDALRPFNIPPGTYALPRANTHKEMCSPEMVEKMEKGPVALMTVIPNGKPKMAGSLIQWFIYCIVVSIFAGYIAGRAVAPGTTYLEVFRFAGCTAFAGYALALLQGSIWFRFPWSSTLKSIFDGLLYALVTAGTFGWLWPHM